MPPIGSLMHPMQSSALSSVVLGVLQSQLAWPQMTLPPPGIPMAQIPRVSDGPRCRPVRTSESNTVLDDPSGIVEIAKEPLIHMTPGAMCVVRHPRSGRRTAARRTCHAFRAQPSDPTYCARSIGILVNAASITGIVAWRRAAPRRL